MNDHETHPTTRAALAELRRAHATPGPAVALTTAASAVVGAEEEAHRWFSAYRALDADYRAALRQRDHARTYARLLALVAVLLAVALVIR